MQGEFKYIWCVEYPHRDPWEIRKIKVYFNSEESAQLFVNNYPNISSKKDLGDDLGNLGPCNWYGSSKFQPKIEKHLGIKVLDQIYTLGQPITFK